MNTGVPETPEQAAPSLRMVRLVSFGAAAALAGLVLLGAASLRYAPFADEEAAPIAVLGAIEPPPPAPPPSEQSRAPRRPEPRQIEAPNAPIEPPPAPPASSEPVVITDPVWVSRPRNLARFYPREAFMHGLSGQVVLDCVVETTGRLACTIASETPEAQGFGSAALAIAAEHVMQPATQNGAAVRGRYRMIVPFTAG
ncbi:MAG: TonB family protein [Hyphomonadaceae bacterium]